MILNRVNVMKGLLPLPVVALAAVLVAGCSGLGRGGGVPAAERLGRIARETARVGKIEGRGKATIENRLGTVEIEFDMVYEPGERLDLKGDLAPGFLPFHGAVEIKSTPDTTHAYVNGMPLVSKERPYPGPIVHPALIAVALGGDWVVAWLEDRGCEVEKKVECSGLAFEFDLDAGTGQVKSWTLEHSDPDGSYDGFLYKSRPQGGIVLPEVLTGMAHPFEVAVYVEYYQINATMR